MDSRLSQFQGNGSIEYKKSDFRVALGDGILTKSLSGAVRFFNILCRSDKNPPIFQLESHTDGLGDFERTKSLQLIEEMFFYMDISAVSEPKQPGLPIINLNYRDGKFKKDLNEHVKEHIKLISKVLLIPTETLILFSLDIDSVKNKKNKEHMVADRDIALRNLLFDARFGIHRYFKRNIKLYQKRYIEKYETDLWVNKFYDVYYIHSLLFEEGHLLDQYTSEGHRGDLFVSLNNIIGLDQSGGSLRKSSRR